MRKGFLIILTILLCTVVICSCSGAGNSLSIPDSREVAADDLTAASSADAAAPSQGISSADSAPATAVVSETSAAVETEAPATAPPAASSQAAGWFGKDDELQIYLDYINQNFAAISGYTESQILSLLVEDLGGDGHNEMILVYLPDDDGTEEGPSVNIDVFTLTDQGAVRLLDRLEYPRGYLNETEVSVVNSPQGKLLYITDIWAGSHGSMREDYGYAFSGGSQLDPVFSLGYSSQYSYTGQGDLETASANTIVPVAGSEENDWVAFSVCELKNGALVYTPDAPNADSLLEVTQAYYDRLSQYGIREEFTPDSESYEPNTYIDRWYLPVTDGRTMLAAVRHSYSGGMHASQDYTGFETKFAKDAEGNLYII